MRPAEASLKAFFIHRLFGHIQSFVDGITQSELLQNRGDAVAAALLRASQEFSVSSQHFYAFYLLGHGLVKLLMVYGLVRRKMWAYPFALAALAGFILYQSYRISHTHSLGLTFLTVFDCAFMLLVWQEYRLARQRHAPVH
jgi:uncharacterized membrane protein